MTVRHLEAAVVAEAQTGEEERRTEADTAADTVGEERRTEVGTRIGVVAADRRSGAGLAVPRWARNTQGVAVAALG